MPTARELLEQADALMRRNRANAGKAAAERSVAAPPGIAPASRDPLPGAPAAAPRTIQREPIAPSVARTSLPVDPTESPRVLTGPAAPDGVARAERDAPSPAVEPDVGIPLLTEAVDARTSEVFLDDIADGTSLAETNDDVPLLTDAVEEIDVPVVDEASRGEPSFWLATERGEASVLGPAPDSVAVVPPPEPVVREAPPVPPAYRDPLGLDQPAPGFASDEWTAAGEERTTVAGVTPLPVPEPEPQRPVPLAAAPEDAAEIDADAAGAHEPAIAAPARDALDDARVREIAEEIRMQVLQRIDIFTDTSLRAQLGERLKPVVDRASADLVAAINQHVGELLRTYVSEAIEREIETWRDGQR